MRTFIVKSNIGKMLDLDWRKYQGLVMISKMFFDTLLMFSATAMSFLALATLYPEGFFFASEKSRYLAIVWIVLSNIIFFWNMGLYQQGISFLNFEETEKIIRASFIAHMVVYPGVVIAAGAYQAIILISISLLGTIFLVTSERFVAYKIAKYNFKKGRFVKRIAIYDACPAGVFILKKLTELPQLGFKPVGFIDNQLERKSIIRTGSEEVKAQIPVLGSIKDLCRIASKYRIEELFVATPAIKAGEMKEIIDFCKKTDIKYRFVPNLIEEPLYRINLYSIGNIPFIKTDDFEIGIMTAILKRILDVVLSVIILIILSPLFALIAILIKKDSRGPVFFSQTRIGKNGVPFTIYKFRTMKSNVPKYGYSPTTSDDSRMTKFGRFLRKTSIDELPQFWNVIKNDMSIVGPRPEMPFIVKQYNAQQRDRLLVKPGITGLWQITLDRSKLIHENLDYDIYYMKNVSLLLDILIIIKTIIFAAGGAGAR